MHWQPSIRVNNVSEAGRPRVILAAGPLSVSAHCAEKVQWKCCKTESIEKLVLCMAMEQVQESVTFRQFQAPDELQNSQKQLDDGAHASDRLEKSITASNPNEIASEEIHFNQCSTSSKSLASSPIFKAGQKVWARSKHGDGFWPATVTKFRYRNHQDDLGVTVRWEDRQGYSSEEEMCLSKLIKHIEPAINLGEGSKTRCKYLPNANAVHLHNQRLESEALLGTFCSSTSRLCSLGESFHHAFSFSEPEVFFLHLQIK